MLASAGACLASEATTKPGFGFGNMADAPRGDVNSLMWQMMAATLVILVVGAVALFMLKKVLPKIRSISHKKICILETAYLGSRKTVHLLQVGSVKLLVASGPQGVVKLDDVTAAFPQEYTDVALRVESETEDSK